MSNKSPFHDAEMAVQTRVGVAEMVAGYGEGFIRPAMPEQHRQFFALLPFIIFATVDKQGFPWPLPLFGNQGFVHTPDNRSLQISAIPPLIDSLDLAFQPGQKAGLLGIELHTRRRNRVNGVIRHVGDSGFTVEVEQSFGNCPQYIQRRELKPVHANTVDTPLKALMATRLDGRAVSLIETADTFFIASRTRSFTSQASSGIDASHRGGRPGFVKVRQNTLCFPDFSGNRFFNTLGNIEADGRVGLFFPDYTTGDALFVSGQARILWDHVLLRQFSGAERFIEVTIEKVAYAPGLMPLLGERIDYAPEVFRTGIWQETRASHTHDYVKLVRKQRESDAVTSFYFAAEAGSSIESYQPGQFLPLQLEIPGQSHTVLRSYTLSRAPVAGEYRISVKREKQGLVSQYLHDQLALGSVVGVGKPAGQFTLRKSQRPIVFISGGVGITPMIAMLEELVRDVEAGASPRRVWFVHATQNSETFAFRSYLAKLEAQYPWFCLYRVFSQPLEGDLLGVTHQSEQRLSADTLQTVAPLDQCDLYLCAAKEFMESMYKGLVQAGVDKANIFYEFFGEGVMGQAPDTSGAVAEKAKVYFARSQRSAVWTPEEGSLLAFAEKQGLTPLFSCRSGRCGACAVRIAEGEVHYSHAPEIEVQGVLICCSQPAQGCSSLVLDL